MFIVLLACCVVSYEFIIRITSLESRDSNDVTLMTKPVHFIFAVVAHVTSGTMLYIKMYGYDVR